MAESKPAKRKRRIIRASETVREKVEKSTNAPPVKKQGVLRLTGRYIATPFRWVGRRLKPLGRFRVLRFIGKILVPPYVRNSWKELRLVTWPGRRESLQLTLAVIIFSIVFGALVTVVDLGIDKVFRKVLIG